MRYTVWPILLGVSLFTVGCGSSVAPSSSAVKGSSTSASSAPRKPVKKRPHHVHYVLGHTFTQVGKTPHFAGVDAPLHKLFVSNLAAGTLTVLNSKTGKPITSIKIGGTLHTVMVDPKKHLVFVTDIQKGLLDEVNAKTDKLLGQVNLGGHVHGLSIVHGFAYVTNIALNEVQVVNIKTMKVVKTIKVGANPWGVSVDPKTNVGIAANTGIVPPKTINPAGKTVTIFNAKTGTVKSTLTVGPHPWNVVINPATGIAYAGIAGDGKVAVIKKSKVMKQITVGKSPHGLAIDYRYHLLFVNNSVSNTVSVINLKTLKVVQTIPVGKQPQGITVNQKTGWVYVVNQAAQTVSVLIPK